MSPINRRKNEESCPSVSVIVPVKNGKEYIHEALASILLQEYEDFETLVIDDGSTDFDYDTLSLIDKRIKVLHLEGLGVSCARNYGMTLARGDFIAFLDADDVWFPGKLQAQISYFHANPDVGVVFGQFLRWYADSTGEFKAADLIWSDCSLLCDAEVERSGWLYTKLLMGLLVGMNTAVIRRTVYEQIGGFNESMRIGEDYDFWLRASRVAPMHSLSGPVALYRIHPASAMHKIAKENHMARLLHCGEVRWGLTNPDQTSLDRTLFQMRIANTHFDHGYLHYWRGDKTIARRSFLMAFLNGGRRLRSAIYYLLACGAALVPNRAKSRIT